MLAWPHRSLELATRLERDRDAHLLTLDLVGPGVPKEVSVDEDLLGGGEEARPTRQQLVDARLVDVGDGAVGVSVDDEALELEAELSSACDVAAWCGEHLGERRLVGGERLGGAGGFLGGLHESSGLGSAGEGCVG